MEEDLRKDNLKADNFNTVIMRDITESHLPVSTVYYILKDILNNVEILYTEQAKKEYQEFCAEAAREAEELANTNEEASSEAETPAAANVEE